MATRTPTIAQAQGPNQDGRHGCFLVTWGGLLNGDVGAAFAGPNFNVKSIHVFGTFGGATLTFQGSNEQTVSDWETLHDQSANALALTAAGVRSVQETVTNLRPSVSGGDGTTSLTVVALMVATSK